MRARNVIAIAGVSAAIPLAWHLSQPVPAVPKASSFADVQAAATAPTMMTLRFRFRPQGAPVAQNDLATFRYFYDGQLRQTDASLVTGPLADQCWTVVTPSVMGHTVSATVNVAGVTTGAADLIAVPGTPVAPEGVVAGRCQ